MKDWLKTLTFLCEHCILEVRKRLKIEKPVKFS